MSSNYHPICLSHDPAIVLDQELRREDTDTITRAQINGHEHCDIVIGRFSYPLIEVACLGRQLAEPTGCKAYHSGVKWIDANWLRLLHAATPHADAALLDRSTFRCWPPERLTRLREELGLAETPAVDDAAEARAVIATVTPTELHDAIRKLAQRDPAWWRNELARMARIEGRANILGGHK